MPLPILTILAHAIPTKAPLFATTIPLPTALRLADVSSAVTAPSHTSPAIVPAPLTPAVPPVSSTRLTRRNRDRVGPEKGTALPGTAPLAVTKVPPYVAAGANIPAPSAAPLLTPRNNVAQWPSLLTVKTPFIPEAWERLLNLISPFNKFSDVPIGIRFGFDMGIRIPPSFTYTPPNHNSALLYPDHVTSHIQNELSLGRYSGPFSKSRLEFLIGPFRTSPLGTVPKTPGSTERRIVQDLSFPRNDSSLSSVNDQIDIEEFRCDWGTFTEVRNIVVNAPEGSEAATLDVDSAFRCCPITPSQQCNFIIHWEDKYYIDHDAPFGASSAGGVFGRVADAKSAILESKQLGPSKNWVDDYVFFRFPINFHSELPVFSYSLSDIYDLATQLGWPWKRSKTKPFASQFKYLGFLWDLSAKTVQLPEDKKLRYLAKLELWTHNQKFSKKDAESVLGTLVHCSLAVPDGRSRLPAISRFTSSFNHTSSPFARRTPSSGALSDISWWRTQLSAAFCGSFLSKPPVTSPIEFWVDASSSWGIGIILGNEWDHWKLRSGWNKDGRNIGWAEIVAIELGLLFAIHRNHSDVHFLIKSDNQGVIHAIEGGKSRSREQNSVLQRITLLLSRQKLWISSSYVPSLDNLADLPSRGLPPQNYPRADSTFPLPPSLQPFLLHPPFVP